MATGFRFVPKADITILELADILKVILDSQSALLSEGMFKQLDTAIRHFEKPVVENGEAAYFLLLSSTPPKT
jgi:hypothetical protein